MLNNDRINNSSQIGALKIEKTKNKTKKIRKTNLHKREIGDRSFLKLHNILQFKQINLQKNEKEKN